MNTVNAVRNFLTETAMWNLQLHLAGEKGQDRTGRGEYCEALCAESDDPVGRDYLRPLKGEV